MQSTDAETEIESALVALGTNMAFGALSGEALLAAALEKMQSSGFEVLKTSSIWQSPAWPEGSDQPDYLNAVVEVRVGTRTPAQVLSELHKVEELFGRTREERWGARTLDLDLLAMGNAVIHPAQEGNLALPHPRLHQRAFVLAPLLEIAPDWVHPLLQVSAKSLRASLSDQPVWRPL